MMVSTGLNTAQLLQQYVLLAKSVRNNAAAELVMRVLDAPGVYVFGELLDMPNIKELENTHKREFELLNLFAYGTYSDWKDNQYKLLPLSLMQEKKLRQLTIVTLATQNKRIPYSKLLTDLCLENLRELEDIIIEVIYADIVHGKLNQMTKTLEIDYTIGRDTKPSDIGSISSVLNEWCRNCENVLIELEEQVKKANRYKEMQKWKEANENTQRKNTKQNNKSYDDEKLNVNDTTTISSGSGTSCPHLGFDTDNILLISESVSMSNIGAGTNASGTITPSESSPQFGASMGINSSQRSAIKPKGRGKKS